MSGFLHQLAARSLGLAPEVRPRAALPYAAPALDTQAAEASAWQPAPAGLAAEAQAPTSTAPKTPASNFKADYAHPAPLLAERSGDKLAANRPANTSSPATAAGNEQLRGLPSQAPHRADSQTEITTSQRNDKASQASPPAAPIYLRPEPAPAQNSQPGNDDPGSGFADLESLVTRLLKPESNQPAPPPNATPSPASAKPPATTQRPAPVSTVRPQASRERPSITEAETSPEVHITIGRLEVKPPGRPAPPPPPRPRGPAPLSLADYLARRNGGRS